MEKNINIEKKSEEKLKTSIKISGMSCASCAATIERTLRKLKGVSKANVNFAAEKAYVEYDASQATKEDLEKAIENAGYKVIKEVKEAVKDKEKVDVLKLKDIGMDNPHCINIIDSALKKLKGINSKELLVNEKATINYNSLIISNEIWTSNRKCPK